MSETGRKKSPLNEHKGLPTPMRQLLSFARRGQSADQSVTQEPQASIVRDGIVLPELPNIDSRPITVFTQFSDAVRQEAEQMDSIYMYAAIGVYANGVARPYFIPDGDTHANMSDRMFQSQDPEFSGLESVIGMQLLMHQGKVKGIVASYRYLPMLVTTDMKNTNQTYHYLEQMGEAVPHDMFVKYPDGIVPVGFWGDDNNYFGGLHLQLGKVVPMIKSDYQQRLGSDASVHNVAPIFGKRITAKRIV